VKEGEKGVYRWGEKRGRVKRSDREGKKGVRRMKGPCRKVGLEGERRKKEQTHRVGPATRTSRLPKTTIKRTEEGKEEESQKTEGHGGGEEREG